jgi:hypothetical protein
MRGALALLLLLLGAPALAEECEVVNTRARLGIRDVLIRVCDGDHQTLPCQECDLAALLGRVPDVLACTLEKTTGCASVVNMRALASPMGQPFTLGALSIAGQTSVTVPEPRHLRVDATIETPAGCTDVEVFCVATSYTGRRLP